MVSQIYELNMNKKERPKPSPEKSALSKCWKRSSLFDTMKSDILREQKTMDISAEP
jgi:hypothetical protein